MPSTNQTNFTSSLYRSSDEGLPDNSVAAAIYFDSSGNAKHSALLITYNADSKLFHYTGESVEYECVDPQVIYYCKTLTFLEPVLMASYVAYCELIYENANPRYGYFYTGSFYENGVFKSGGDYPEYMTCVGFCLNVIKTCLSGETDFINYSDWDESTLQKGDEYLEDFLQKVKWRYPNIELSDFKENIRRIRPIEYFTGAYADNIPVPKSFVDEYRIDVQLAIVAKRWGLFGSNNI